MVGGAEMKKTYESDTQVIRDNDIYSAEELTEKIKIEKLADVLLYIRQL